MGMPSASSFLGGYVDLGLAEAGKLTDLSVSQGLAFRSAAASHPISQ